LISDSENFEIQNEHGESSWFGFSLVLKNKLAGKRENLIKLLTHHKVDTRPIVAGNFTLNPVMKHLDFQPLTNLDNSNNIHWNGFFIGNHHYDVTLELKKVYDLLIEFEKEHAI
jgi:CDP-6-deoxy-D-xylo-4-hexulose-3-dehydrase